MNIREIISRVADFYRVKPGEVTMVRRNEPFATMRCLVCEIGLREEIHSVTIGGNLGILSHWSAKASAKNLRRRLEGDAQLRADLEALVSEKDFSPDRFTWADKLAAERKASKQRKLKESQHHRVNPFSGVKTTRSIKEHTPNICVRVIPFWFRSRLAGRTVCRAGVRFNFWRSNWRRWWRE